ncbi:unnamed protein product [Choristocarpus tenellus]
MMHLLKRGYWRSLFKQYNQVLKALGGNDLRYFTLELRKGSVREVYQNQSESTEGLLTQQWIDGLMGMRKATKNDFQHQKHEGIQSFKKNFFLSVLILRSSSLNIADLLDRGSMYMPW